MVKVDASNRLCTESSQVVHDYCKSSESELSSEEVKKAETKCCKWVQEKVYKEDWILFTAGNIDRAIGRYSGRYPVDTRSIVGRHSVETRSIVVPDVSRPI